MNGFINPWIWEKVEVRAKKIAGRWILSEYGFEDLVLSGKHYGTAIIISKNKHIKNGKLCLMSGHFSFERKRTKCSS